MEENKDLNSEKIINELSSRIEDIIADQVESAVSNAVSDVLPEALSESLSNFEFLLPDGTIVKPRQRMKLLSPDKSQLDICYGGLRVEGTSLVVQTDIGSWNSIAKYQSREEAIEALVKVQKAMNSDVTVFEL